MASLLFAATLPALVLACGGDAHLYARQDPPASSAGSSAAPTPLPSSAQSTPLPSVSGLPSSGVLTSAISTATFSPSFSLASTNPTAVPLSSIVPGDVVQTTTYTYSTFAAGATPTYMEGAPGLPDISKLNPANYPALDIIPPTDSPEVQQWVLEVNNSGIPIPNFAPTVAGGCAFNTAAQSDGRCWWTCGGCTREVDVTECPDKMTWGLTYDDGPAPYTPLLLNYLAEQQLKTTFFATGSRSISYPAMLQSEYMQGHQIAVHTWSHHELTQMTNEQIIAELGWTRKVMKDILGVTPNTWRPPYGDIDDRVRNISIAMNLTPVMWTRISPYATFDTGDFSLKAGTVTPEQVLTNWELIVGNATTRDHGFIVLEHDLFPQTVEMATGYILPDALAHQPKFDIKPVISCLNKPLSDAYVETNDNSTNPPPVSGGPAVTLTEGAPGAATTGTGTGSGSETSGSSGSSGSPSAASRVSIGSPAAFVALATLVGGAVVGALLL